MWFEDLVEGPGSGSGICACGKGPVFEPRTTVPIVVEVKWVTEDKHGAWHAGLEFML
jgi:hypothetical protein